MSADSYPKINLLQQAEQDLKLLPPQKFMSADIAKVDKVEWKESYQIQDFSMPSAVDSPNINKLFKIQVTIYDSESNKYFSKTLYFGQPSDYIFTKNRQDRLHKLTLMKHMDNPLHANYWRAHLCLAGPDFKANFHRLSDFVLQKRQKVVESKIAKGKSKVKAPRVLSQNDIKNKKQC